MSCPAYIDNGGIVAAGDTYVDVPFMSTINADDYLIVQLLDADDDSFSPPDESWGEIYQEGASSNASHAYYGKKADGTETGVARFTSGKNAGSGVYGVMSRYSNVNTDTPFEGVNGQPVTQTSTPTIPALTSTSGQRLAIGFVTVEDNIAVTGETNYTSGYQETSTFGGDANLAMFYQQITSSPSSEALSCGNEYIGVCGLVLIPQPDVPVTLNTADLHDFGDDTTPTVEFTGDAASNLDIEYEIQIDTINTFDSQGEESTEDSYSESNQDTDLSTNPSDGYIYRGQSFLASVGEDLSKATFYLKKLGSPTGIVVAQLWSIDNDTLGSGNEPNTLLATSGSIDVSTIGTNYALLDFLFTGEEQYTIVDGIAYVVILYFDYTSTDPDNKIYIGSDNTSPSHQGDSYFDSGAFIWNAGTDDICFYVVTSNGYPLLNKLSETPDAEFINTTDGADTHPFDDNEKISYTVQSGDALAYDTYYWRVRAKNPTGENIYDDWSAIRSFDVTEAGGISATQTESETAVDTESAVNIGTALQTESGTGVDTKGAIKTTNAVVADTESVVDANLATFIVGASIAETETLVDTTDATIAAGIIEAVIAESETAIDDNDAVLIAEKAIVESETAVDTNLALGILLSSNVETETIVDVNSALGVLLASNEESESVVDTNDAVLVGNKAVIESETVVDTNDALVVLSASNAEVVTAEDVNTALGVLLASIAENETVVDTNAAVSVGNKIVVESESAEEITSSTKIGSVFIAENETISDTESAIKETSVSQTESETVIDTTDAAIAAGVVGASIFEVETVAETVSAKNIALTSTIESESVVDTNEAASERNGSIEEAESSVDTSNSVKIAVSDTDESGSAVDANDAIKETNSVIGESSTVVDTIDATIAAGIVGAESVESASVVETLSATIIRAVSISEIGTAEDANSATLISVADIAEGNTLEDTVSGVSNLLATQNEVGTLEDVITSSKILTDAVSEIVNAVDTSFWDVLIGELLDGNSILTSILSGESNMTKVLDGESNMTKVLDGESNMTKVLDGESVMDKNLNGTSNLM